MSATIESTCSAAPGPRAHFNVQFAFKKHRAPFRYTTENSGVETNLVEEREFRGASADGTTNLPINVFVKHMNEFLKCIVVLIIIQKERARTQTSSKSESFAPRADGTPHLPHQSLFKTHK